MKKEKTLGQIAYGASESGAGQNFGPWDKAPDIVRRVHEEIAEAVKKEILRRLNRDCIQEIAALNKKIRKSFKVTNT